jgi:hypothetical protein
MQASNEKYRWEANCDSPVYQIFAAAYDSREIYLKTLIGSLSDDCDQVAYVGGDDWFIYFFISSAENATQSRYAALARKVARRLGGNSVCRKFPPD